VLHKLRHTLNRLTVDRVLIYVEASIVNIPELPTAPGVSIRDLDHQDPAEISLWLSIFNDAFGLSWGESRFQKRIVNDRYIDMIKTMVLSVDGTPSAVATIGVFRGNPSRAALHYISVRSSVQGRGFGAQLASHGARQLATAGYSIVENEIPSHRVHSFKMHHRLGFKVKPAADSWNTPPIYPRVIQKRAQLRTRALIRQW
jgi:ribosomal protein S18 acetylase RimI-like enzyme